MKMAESKNSEIEKNKKESTESKMVLKKQKRDETLTMRNRENIDSAKKVRLQQKTDRDRLQCNERDRESSKNRVGEKILISEKAQERKVSPGIQKMRKMFEREAVTPDSETARVSKVKEISNVFEKIMEGGRENGETREKRKVVKKEKNWQECSERARENTKVCKTDV